MADEEAKDTNDTATDTAPASNNLKLIVVLVLGSLFLISATVITLFVLNKSMGSAPVVSEVEEIDSEAMDDTADAGSKTPHFYKVRPTFVVNIPSNGRIRFLQVNVEVLAHSEDAIVEVEKYEPLIKNDIITLFASQRFEEIITPDGREVLREYATDAVKKIMIEHTGREQIEEVLFTSFVTQ